MVNCIGSNFATEYSELEGR